MGTIVIVLLVLLLLGALPTWPYSSSWGYYPSGGLGLVLLIVVDPGAYGKSLTDLFLGPLWNASQSGAWSRVTSARIWVHSETIFPATCPHFESGSACL